MEAWFAGDMNYLGAWFTGMGNWRRGLLETGVNGGVVCRRHELFGGRGSPGIWVIWEIKITFLT